jgi:hypothetical protein
MRVGEFMVCRGCGTTFGPGNEDGYVEHVLQRCEFVDGAGNPRIAACRHCGRPIQPGLVDGVGKVGWVHADDDEAPCEPADAASPLAEPTA